MRVLFFQQVLSGTEFGNLLLWEGGLVKIVFTRKNERPCHSGPIEVVFLCTDENVFVTGGSDGYIRKWCYQEIDSAGRLAFLERILQMYVSKGVDSSLV